METVTNFLFWIYTIIGSALALYLIPYMQKDHYSLKEHAVKMRMKYLYNIDINKVFKK